MSEKKHKKKKPTMLEIILAVSALLQAIAQLISSLKK
ncbi:unnamed protein product [Fructobacillus tropaeoli]|uniref:Uncharacterized protein n=1 Tax=Fructobacillus cardui TaxID=2893170 RepID=A0ABN9YZZ5_9LACO|nr:unnamed protein product [Fructobacillus cardui]CAK1245543.1 unnamed protein product [Fructobacillus tropaeoli]CAK1254359.1 unnamed protein product [Fructobacillus cardui]